MRRLPFVLLLIVVCVGGLGFYRGWFGLTSDRTNDTQRITFTVDGESIKKDVKTTTDRIPNVGGSEKPSDPRPTPKAN